MQVIEPLKPTKREHAVSINAQNPRSFFVSALSQSRPKEKPLSAYDRSSQSSPIRKSPFSFPSHNYPPNYIKDEDVPDQGTRFIVKGYQDVTFVLICVSKSGQYVLYNLNTSSVEWRYPSELIEIGGPIDYGLVED
ncbi:hypothetical protein TVAG_189820 [Trichomonas vaginalis G3]|uniref:Uncharacterized protein n=1 Tax=Trichomonas vaginalis (strain ATCC PRA-98 / G3) TaxID=412133 RepID=A2DKB4_TRIV3|nr:hypothetical protein TVAGG3_0995960 [Trichomonas vaginalis G3]EAY19091.1 hypothetical protein TVAG_189820 [Trichomonas vaginalis G3]KAI5490390.1 hypothetical protein TVAGG3_0995960 [Trichomonas vaginalis G3]|eukprot:XP_001580077.1 hypothetical protein [Trichomonas vaginalis G3]